MLYQTTRSTQITVGPKSVLTLYCVPKNIVSDLCSHISVQGKWLVLSCSLFGGFTGLEGNIGCQILGGLEPPPPAPPAPTPLLHACNQIQRTLTNPNPSNQKPHYIIRTPILVILMCIKKKLVRTSIQKVLFH